MEITSNLRTFLLTDTNVSAAFGVRIYVVNAPDNPSYPFAIIRKVSPSPDYSHDGRWKNDDLVQIDVYDDDLSGCVSNAGLIESKLDGYAGEMGNVSNAIAFIEQAPIEEWSPEARHYHSRIDITIKWTV